MRWEAGTHLHGVDDAGHQRELAVDVAEAQQPLLQGRHVLGRHVEAEPAPREHDAIDQAGERREVVDHRRTLHPPAPRETVMCVHCCPGPLAL